MGLGQPRRTPLLPGDVGAAQQPALLPVLPGELAEPVQDAAHRAVLPGLLLSGRLHQQSPSEELDQRGADLQVYEGSPHLVPLLHSGKQEFISVYLEGSP